MPLDPKAEMLLAQMPKLHVEGMQIDEVRRQSAEGSALFSSLYPPPVMEQVEDLMVPTTYGDRLVRRYVPKKRNLPYPVVFYHGGGFVLGDVESYHGMTAQLAETLGAIVFSVDYSRAPEAKFPRPVMECYEVTAAIAQRAQEFGLPSQEVVLAGDSAGGNFAAVVAQLARDHGTFDVKAQLLFYPAVDMVNDTPSKDEFATGYFLEADVMRWFGEQYLRDVSDAPDVLASPALNRNLRGLPPAFIVTAEFDPLRDEGEAYAAQLSAQRVPVVHRRYPGMMHGFMSMPIFDQAVQAMDEAAQFLHGR